MALLGKTISVRYGFQRIELDKEELEKVMKELLEYNYNELDKIAKFLEGKGIKYKENPEFLAILAERQLVSSFMVWANALEDMAFRLKNKYNKPLGKETLDKIKKTVAEQFGEKKDITPAPEEQNA